MDSDLGTKDADIDIMIKGDFKYMNKISLCRGNDLYLIVDVTRENATLDLIVYRMLLILPPFGRAQFKKGLNPLLVEIEVLVEYSRVSKTAHFDTNFTFLAYSAPNLWSSVISGKLQFSNNFDRLQVEIM